MEQILRIRLKVAESLLPRRDEDGGFGFREEIVLASIRYMESVDLLEKGSDFAFLHGMEEASAFLWGKIHYHEGNMQKAVVHLEASRELLLQYLGRREPRLVEVLETLYLCYTEMGDRERALQALQEALEIAQAIFVPNHFTRLRLEDYAQKTE